MKTDIVHCPGWGGMRWGGCDKLGGGLVGMELGGGDGEDILQNISYDDLHET